MNEQPKPCPLCGRVPGISKWDDGSQTLLHHNLTDPADYCVLSAHYPISLWNKRPVEDALRAALEAIVTELNASDDSYKARCTIAMHIAQSALDAMGSSHVSDGMMLLTMIENADDWMKPTALDAAGDTP